LRRDQNPTSVLFPIEYLMSQALKKAGRLPAKNRNLDGQNEDKELSVP
jgi:hypothetical protein